MYNSLICSQYIVFEFFIHIVARVNLNGIENMITHNNDNNAFLNCQFKYCRGKNDMQKREQLALLFLVEAKPLQSKSKGRYLAKHDERKKF